MTAAPSPAEAWPAWLKPGNGSVTLRVSARPRSTRAGALRVSPMGLVLGLNSAPQRGKANSELIALVARLARVPRSAVTIVRGQTGRDKVIRISTDAPRQVATMLTALAPDGRKRFFS